jgi:very-short-patch-repair endonuclease
MRKNEQRSRTFAKELRRRMTDAEVILWSRRRRRSFDGAHRFRRQHPIGPYIADFACASAWLVVEVDGDTHGSPDEIAYDRRRDAFLKERGWRVLRVTNRDIYDNLGGVLDGIGRALPWSSTDG